jgi:hypothetical protein
MAQGDILIRSLTQHGEKYLSVTDLGVFLTGLAEHADQADDKAQMAATCRVVRDMLVHDLEQLPRG